jgi:hypothetical protein
MRCHHHSTAQLISGDLTRYHTHDCAHNFREQAQEAEQAQNAAQRSVGVQLQRWEKEATRMVRDRVIATCVKRSVNGQTTTSTCSGGTGGASVAQIMRSLHVDQLELPVSWRSTRNATLVDSNYSN